MTYFLDIEHQKKIQQQQQQQQQQRTFKQKEITSILTTSWRYLTYCMTFIIKRIYYWTLCIANNNSRDMLLKSRHHQVAHTLSSRLVGAAIQISNIDTRSCFCLGFPISVCLVVDWCRQRLSRDKICFSSIYHAIIKIEKER